MQLGTYSCHLHFAPFVLQSFSDFSLHRHACYVGRVLKEIKSTLYLKPWGGRGLFSLQESFWVDLKDVRDPTEFERDACEECNAHIKRQPVRQRVQSQEFDFLSQLASIWGL